jgi:hypothetical protein
MHGWDRRESQWEKESRATILKDWRRKAAAGACMSSATGHQIVMTFKQLSFVMP